VAGSGRSFLPAWPGYAAMLVSAAQKALQPVHQNTALQSNGGLAQYVKMTEYNMLNNLCLVVVCQPTCR